MSKTIFKVRAVIVHGGKLLVVRKITPDNRLEYIIPGGRKKGHETHQETLVRELREELGVELVDMGHFGSFDETAIFENVPLHMEVYVVTTRGAFQPRSEVKEYAWIDRNYEAQGIKLGSVLARHVVPELVSRGLM